MAQRPTGARSEDTSTRVRRLLTGRIVHVRLAGVANADMLEIGGVEIGQGQSPDMGNLNLATEISLGAVHIPVTGRSYEWSLSGCRIALLLENATVIPGSSYEDVQEGRYEANSKEEHIHDASKVMAAQGEVKIGAGFHAMIPSYFVKLMGGASAKGEKEERLKDSSGAAIVQHFVRVQREGHRIWRAVDDSGGRLRRTRDLRGIIVSPFRKRATKAGATAEEEATPLARLQATDPTKPVYGLISIRAYATDYVLDGSHDQTEEARVLHEALGDGRASYLVRRSAAEGELRRRVAALAGVRKTTNEEEHREGVDLFCCAFCFEPDLPEGGT